MGLGLIGGSAALDLKRAGFAATVIGVEADPRRAEAAHARGLVDSLATTEAAARMADLVLIATPVDAAVRLLPAVLSAIRPDAVVLDMGSTKQSILAAAAAHPARARFVATHPMAGAERSGPEAAQTGLFQGKTAILCDRAGSAPDAVERVLSLYAALGMRVVELEAAAHDRQVAYVSHLPHALAYAFMRAVLGLGSAEAERAQAVAGTGFASVARLAKSPAGVWVPIFLQNRAALLEALDATSRELDALRTALANNDAAALERLIRDVHRKEDA